MNFLWDSGQGFVIDTLRPSLCCFLQIKAKLYSFLLDADHHGQTVKFLFPLTKELSLKMLVITLKLKYSHM